MAEFEVVGQYTRDGKIKKNVDGRVVLSMGVFVPRMIPGIWLKDRVDKWHKHNPGNIIVAGLAVVGNSMYKCVQPTSTVSTDEIISGKSLKLSAEDRIEELEREILALKKHKFNGVVITHPKGFKPTAGKTVPTDPVELPNSPALKEKEPEEVEILKAGPRQLRKKPTLRRRLVRRVGLQSKIKICS
jgi:hypothetical protein